MASCVKNIPAKIYQNLVIGFQVTVENVGDVIFETQCIYMCVCVVCCSGRGAIITVSSTAGSLPAPLMTVYSATKVCNYWRTCVH